MNTEHLPVLLVVVLLLAAPLVVLSRSGRAGWAITALSSFIAFACAVGLFFEVRDGAVISYAIGNWAPPWGIEYRVDVLNAFVLVLVSGVGAVVSVYARTSVIHEIPSDRHYLFYAMFALCLSGLLGMTVTNDVFNIFVFLEISSLSGYVLIALGRARRALHAAFQYLILGTIGATFYIIGVGFLYLVTGTLNIVDMSARIQSVADYRPVLAALAFMTVGLSLKAALFPLHGWLPGAYSTAPGTVAAFMAGTATKVSIYVLIRLLFGVFGARLVLRDLPLLEALSLLSIAAMLVASLVAVMEKDLKRLLAYSSVAQIGYITLGVSLANTDGLTAAVLHLFNHGIAKVALFMLVGGAIMRFGNCRLDSLAGMGRRMPLSAIGIVFAGLSLIGVPGTAGFITKWHLVLAAVEAGHWLMVASIGASSMLAAAYVWRFVEAAYFTPPASQPVREAPAGMLVPGLAMTAACVYFGLDTSFTVGAASNAAAMLLGGLR
jgi:multicomponent Na+:H+ antiporter subunit D